jgi:predicted nucleotide-binding protein
MLGASRPLTDTRARPGVARERTTGREFASAGQACGSLWPNKTGADAVYKPRVFIGSSTSALDIANSLKKGLVMRGCGDVEVWNKGVFGVNRGFLETLLNAREKFDYAVMVWSAADSVNSQAAVPHAPRDNVVFETGLFMGAMGRDNVFVMYDEKADLKIPSDFEGITLVKFDGQTAGHNSLSKACATIAKAMTTPRYAQYCGEWRSRYTKAGYKNQEAVIDEVDIVEGKGGIVFVSRPLKNTTSYVAYGKVCKEQQIIGEWRHEEGRTFIDGLFMLTVNETADIMAGYTTARDNHHQLMFETWVLAKADGRSEAEIGESLTEEEVSLRDRTLGLPLKTCT